MHSEKRVRRMERYVAAGGGVFLASFALAFFAGLFSERFFLGTTAVETAEEMRDAIPAAAGGGAVIVGEEQGIGHDPPSLPQRVVIPSVGIDFSVTNPSASDIPTLDAALLEGVVRYPRSGTLASDAPMFLFGHSSYLPNVENKAFQAFNNLEKVNVGDTVLVLSNDTEYRYRVKSVILADADFIRVPLGGSDKTLTLSTCNSFGAKQERFVVEADFVSVSPAHAPGV